MAEPTRLATTTEALSPSGRDNPMAIALATYNDKNQLAVIRDQICVGATPSEMWVFLARCVALGLDPFSKQIYFIKRDSKNGPVVAHQIGIDGFRSVAARTDQLVGISEPEYEGETECKGQRVPAVARVTVTKEIRGKDREFAGVARWTEFYPGDQLGFMWQKMPYHMLSKCAEAQAMRRAFPQQMGGLQTDAEAMGYEGMMAAADSARFNAPREPQYIEVTDTETGEMTRVRAGDEYARLYPVDDDSSVPAISDEAQEQDDVDIDDRMEAMRTDVAVRVERGLCAHPECVEHKTTNKAAADTDPPRCLNHLER